MRWVASVVWLVMLSASSGEARRRPPARHLEVTWRLDAGRLTAERARVRRGEVPALAKERWVARYEARLLSAARRGAKPTRLWAGPLLDFPLAWDAELLRTVRAQGRVRVPYLRGAAVLELCDRVAGTTHRSPVRKLLARGRRRR